jgi:hypothetical protein
MNKKPDDLQVSGIRRYALVGVAFGFLFPVISTIMEVLLSQHPLNFSSIYLVQASDPLLWVIDTAPIFLGLFAAYAGREHDMVSKINWEMRNREVELEANKLNLEQYINDRASELQFTNLYNERRARQFEAISFQRSRK